MQREPLPPISVVTVFLGGIAMAVLSMVGIFVLTYVMRRLLGRAMTSQAALDAALSVMRALAVLAGTYTAGRFLGGAAPRPVAHALLSALLLAASLAASPIWWEPRARWGTNILLGLTLLASLYLAARGAIDGENAEKAPPRL